MLPARCMPQGTISAGQWRNPKAVYKCCFHKLVMECVSTKHQESQLASLTTNEHDGPMNQ